MLSLLSVFHPRRYWLLFLGIFQLEILVFWGIFMPYFFRYQSATWLNRVVIGQVPFYLLILRLAFYKRKKPFRWLTKRKLAIFILVALAIPGGKLLIHKTVFTPVLFFHLYQWEVLPMASWLIMSLSFLYFYSKKFWALDAFVMAAFTSRAMGDIWELPVYFVTSPNVAALVRSLFITFQVGWIYVVILAALAYQFGWRRPRGLITAALLFSMAEVLLVASFYIGHWKHFHLLGVLARVLCGICLLLVTVGFSSTRTLQLDE